MQGGCCEPVTEAGMCVDGPALGPGSGLGEAIDVSPPELTKMLCVASSGHELGRRPPGPIPALGKFRLVGRVSG